MSQENDTTERERSNGAPPRAENEIDATGGGQEVEPKRATSPKARPGRAKAKSTKAESASAPKSRRAPAKKAGAPPSRRSAPPRSQRARTRDEASIPPTWSDLDEHGERVVTADATPFVPAPPPTETKSPSAGDASEPDPVLVPRPSVSPYLKAAVGLVAAAALVLVGGRVLRHAPRHLAPSPGLTAAAAVAVGPAAVDPIPESPPAPADPPADTSTPESAADAKAASLAALVQGKLDEAIAAGERATTLDPTDGDSWRILGAAYQNKGDIPSARRCYRECTKSATRGDVRECTFLLQ